MPPNADTHSLLSEPRLSPGQIPELIEGMRGPHRATKVLRVAPDLLEKWTTGEIEAPRTALLAMFWQSDYGFAQAFSDSHWTHQYNSMLKNEARKRVELLEAYIQAKGLDLPPGRLTTHKEMLSAGPEDPSSYQLKKLARAKTGLLGA